MLGQKKKKKFKNFSQLFGADRARSCDIIFLAMGVMFGAICKAPAARSNPRRGGPARGGHRRGGPEGPLGANFFGGRRADAPSHARGARQTARGSIGAFSRGGGILFILIRETWRKIKF